MVNVSVSTNQANIPVGFDKEIIQAIRYDAVIQKTVTMEKWNKSMGQTIYKNRGVNWAKQFKYPNTAITPNAYVTTSEPLFIDTFEVAALLLEDFGKLFIPDEVLADQAESMGYALSRAVETALSNLFQSFSQQVTGTAYNVPLTYADATEAMRLLRVGGVKPSTKDTFFLISPNQTAAYKNTDVFVNSLYGGANATNNFERATLSQTAVAGASIVESMLLRAPSGGGHDMAMYSRDAIRMAFAQSPTRFEDFYGLDLGTVQGYKQAYGYTRSYRTVETAGSSALTDSWATFLPGV